MFMWSLPQVGEMRVKYTKRMLACILIIFARSFATEDEGGGRGGGKAEEEEEEGEKE